MDIKEKRHRLPKEYYVGAISVAFTLCLEGKSKAFIKPEIVKIFTDILTFVVTTGGCIVPVYCFMPNHQHLIITGSTCNSDVWKAIVKYKQKTGFWMSVNEPEMKWQKDFYDHIIRTSENITTQVRYILDNPGKERISFILAGVSL